MTLPTPPKPEPMKKPETKGEWVGKSRYEIDRYLKSSQGRSELSREVGITSGNFTKQNEAIKKVEEMIPRHFGSVVDNAETRSLNFQLNQQNSKERRKLFQGPNWQKEAKERKMSEKERGFLKKKFGIK